MRRCAIVSLILGAFASGCTQNASQQDGEYPHKPIKIIVPFGAGGGSDTFTRMMQKAIRDESLLPQPVVVLNVPGAGGTIGSRRVKDARPDGYTLLNLHGGMLTAKHAGRVGYGPESFEPIAATGQTGLVICVARDSAFGDLRSLLSKAAEAPDEVLFGTAFGTPSHFAGLRLEAASNARFRYVQSGGGAKRFGALIGGHIHVSPFSVSEYVSFRDGGLRAIAYLAGKRHATCPDVPTAKELGIDVAAFNVHYWWAPKGTPPQRIRQLADMFERAMKTEFVRGKLAEMSMEPLFLRGDALRKHLQQRESELSDVALVPYDNLPRPLPYLACASLLCLILMFVGRRTDGDNEPPQSTAIGRSAKIVGAIGAFAASLQFSGIPFAYLTMIFVPAAGGTLGARTKRQWVLLAIAGASLGWLCVFVFTQVLVIDLP